MSEKKAFITLGGNEPHEVATWIRANTPPDPENSMTRRFIVTVEVFEL